MVASTVSLVIVTSCVAVKFPAAGEKVGVATVFLVSSFGGGAVRRCGAARQN